MSAQSADYVVDPARLPENKTGIYVRAMLNGRWGTHDIAHLNTDSLWRWLHSRDNADWPSNVVLVLLGHSQQQVGR